MLVSLMLLELLGQILLYALHRLVYANSIMFMIVGFCGVTFAADMFYWLVLYIDVSISIQAIMFLATLLIIKFKNNKDLTNSEAIEEPLL